MSTKRTIPLQSPTIEKHQCTIDIRMDKLSDVPFFKSLDREKLQQINAKFDASHFEAGAQIYYEGERATMLRVVVYGAVKLIRHTDDGKDILVDMLKPGEYFGSLTEIGDGVYSETAIAQSDVCILSLNNHEFRTVLNDHPSVAIAVLDIATYKLNAARKRIQQITTLPVEKRIAYILMRLCDKFGEKSDVGMLLQLPLSRKDLADMVGTSTETASRIMSRFQQDELITSGRQWVAIKDVDALSKVVPS